MNDSGILIINDITGYGRVSTFAMLPVMAQYGLHPYVLPTALVSNATDYGSCEILDTSEYMKSTISKWNDFGFSFNNICTGFINSAEQLDIICKLIESQNSPFVLVDPIMADGGCLYDGMYPGAVECNRRLASYADVIVPNLTEAELLADMYTGQNVLSDSEYLELARAVSDLGIDNVVISGCNSQDGRSFNLVYSKDDDLIKKKYFEKINDSYVGTGDVFSACLISELIRGCSLDIAVEQAAEFVRKVILDNSGCSDHFDLHIEKSLRHISTDFNYYEERI